MDPLPRPLERQRRALSRALGRPVRVRAVRTPDRELRGRLRVDPDRVVIEYQVSQEGYFWYVPVAEELLSRAAAGEREVELRHP